MKAKPTYPEFMTTQSFLDFLKTISYQTESIAFQIRYSNDTGTPLIQEHLKQLQYMTDHVAFQVKAAAHMVMTNTADTQTQQEEKKEELLVNNSTLPLNIEETVANG